MRRTPLQRVGDRIGMYAYLAAVGGLKLWPRIRELTVEEYTRAPEGPPPVEAFAGNVAQERDHRQQTTPVE